MSDHTERTLYLHIGSPKTATTTIQQFLHDHRDHLANEKITYLHAPKRADYIDLPMSFVALKREQAFFRRRRINSVVDRERFRREAHDQFLEFVTKERDVSTFIISSEHFFRLMSEEEIGAAVDFLSHLFSNIRIICYIRNSADLLLSRYSTKIKSGGTESLEQYVSGDHGRIDFGNKLELWASIFGRDAITVELFGKSAVQGGEILNNFLAHCGLPHIDASGARRANPSLSASSITLLRAFNALTPEPLRGPRWIENLRSGLIQQLETRGGEKLHLTPEQRHWIIEQSRVGNDIIRELFFEGREAYFDSVMNQ